MSDQPKPTPNSNPAIVDLVLADIQERDHIGQERYGTRLQAHNGRNPLQDAYEEALDQAIYLRQELEERSKLKAEHERHRRALELIANYDPDKAFGYTDEWTEAGAFRHCRRVASDALDPAT